MSLSRLLREPVLHFLALGVLVWFVDAAGGEQGDREILVTERQVARIVALWERQWRRPPTADELRSLLEDRIREEILYREALRLGLDEDDTVIRRRLAQKLAFVSEDRVVPSEPPLAELEDFFAARVEDYRQPARFTLRQVPFTGASGEAVAAAALERLPGLPEEALSTLGDASLLPRQVRRWTAREVTAEFGRDFLTAVDTAQVGRWQGPVRSAFGYHAVRVDAFEPEAPATLAAVRREVERDWLAARREQANDAYYETLRARYRVRVEGGAFVTAVDGG